MLPRILYSALLNLSTVLGFLGTVSFFRADADPGSPAFVKDIRPILAAHCFACHGPEKKKAGVNLADIVDEPAALRQRKLWRKVAEQVETQEMPPAKEPQPTPEQRQLLLSWIKQALRKADANEAAARNPGPGLVRRLNRTEYNRTLRDLLGIDFNAAEAVGMPDDGVVQGFDNQANALGLSQAQLEKYLAAADKVLERILGREDGSPSKDNFNRQQAQKARDTLLSFPPLEAQTKRQAARQIIERFARRAYRRPLEKREVDRLLKLYDFAVSRGERFENGVRLMCKAVLVSPHFLLRLEQDRAPTGSKEAYPVSDHELAVRLSYFLWSTMPDDLLFSLAEQQKLHEPAVLEEQVKRMLADPKARALTDSFGVQWLQLPKLRDARPSQEFFPAFSQKLRQAMHDETVTFFDKLREEDKSILHLLDADYTYVNQDLAKHYNLPPVEGGQMRRVQLRPEDHRGGLLGMAGILTMTSHTSRTSPTQRGKWVLDVIFGTPPSPPPPDAGVLKEEKDKSKMPKTFRELMARHATQTACAACHKKMDPLGFALDAYDAIGGWRQGTDSQPLDTTGQLPTGEQFNGPGELKQIILRRQDEFVRNLAEQLLTYALGRELRDYDEPTVRDVTTALKKNEHRFSTLVLEIVKSYPFRHRRNIGDEAD